MEWIKITYTCNGFSPLLDVYQCSPLVQTDHVYVCEGALHV